MSATGRCAVSNAGEPRDPERSGDSAALLMLRRGSRDMAALLALPAMWADRSASDIATDLVNVLFAMLRLESAYVRFDNPAGAIESWRPAGSNPLPELDLAIRPEPDQRAGTTTVETGGYRVTSIVRVFQDECGLVLAGSRRADFPTDLELYLMGVVAGQAAIAIHSARQLAAERTGRIAAELALRTRTEFLAKLAADLASPLGMLSERAVQAGALAVHAPFPDPALALPAGADRLLPDAAPRPNPPAGLSQREAEVLGLLGQGLSNKEIGGVMWLSDRTVERHVTNVYRKLGVERRGEATALALRYGLVPPPSA